MPKRLHPRALAWGLALAGLGQLAVACVAGPAGTPGQAPVLQAPGASWAAAVVPALRGRVQWGGLGLLATEGQVVDRATVSLIEASSGQTKLAGVTDASGNFSLIDDSASPSFNPSVGQLFLLEAVKGLPGASGLAHSPGLAAPRLRSVARYAAGSSVWESAYSVGGSHRITQGTTAVAIALALKGQDPAATSPNAYDRAIASFNGSGAYLGTTELGTAEQDHVATLVAHALQTRDLDPVAALAFANGTYTLRDPGAGLYEGLLTNNACTAPTLGTPGGMTYSLDHRYLYVTNNVANQMRVFRYDTTLTTGACVAVFAGQGTAGNVDGAPGTARFSNPRGIAADQAGNLYVADAGNHSIRRIDAAGNVSTLAGLGGTSGNADGVASAARFNTPEGLSYDGQGALYVGDQGNNRIRKVVIDTATVSTLNVTTPVPSDVRGLTCDGRGNLYFLDPVVATGKLRRISLSDPATSTAIAGTGTGTTRFSATGTAVRFGTTLNEVLYDGARYLYVTDPQQLYLHRVDTLHPTFATRYVAGTGASSNTISGLVGVSRISNLAYGMAWNPLTQVLYLADGNRLRRFAP